MEQLYTERGYVQKRRSQDASTPWSLAVVTLLAFFLPAGGAAVTMQNMRRLGQVDERRSRELTVATILVFAAGYAALLLVGAPDPSGRPTVSSSATVVLSLGTAAAAFLYQRHGFVSWRQGHPQERSGPWYQAVAWALIYELLTFVVTVPVSLLLTVVTSAGS
jgi:fatty acid desaturase